MDFINDLLNVNFLLLFALIFTLGNLFYSFVLVYHLTRFGIGTEPKTTALVYFSGSIVFLLVLVFFLAQIDFREILMGVRELNNPLTP